MTRPDGGVVLLQLSKAELLQMKTDSGRDSRSVSTGELLHAGNLVGTGKTTVHKAASGLRGPRTVKKMGPQPDHRSILQSAGEGACLQKVEPPSPGTPESPEKGEAGSIPCSVA